MILVFTSQKGGVGKSTLALSVGWELKAQGYSVLMVDTDEQRTLQGTAETAADRKIESPTVVFMGKELYRPEHVPRLAKLHDHVIIDTPGKLGDIQKAALAVATIALVPVGHTPASIMGTKAAVEVVQEVQRYRKELYAALVMTAKKPRTVLGKAARDAYAAAELPLLKSETTNRVAWEECLGAGQGVAQYAPEDEAAQEVKALVKELLELSSPPLKRKVSRGKA